MLLPLWVAGLALGDAAGIELGRPGFWLSLAAAILASAGSFRGHRPVLGGAATAFALGLCLGHAAAREVVLDAPLARAVAAAAPVMVEAVWVRPLVDRGGGDLPGHALLDIVSVDERSAHARLSLGGLRPGGPEPLPGDRVRFRVQLGEPLGLANPELPDARLQARAQGIDLVASLARAEPLVIVVRAGWYLPRRWAARLHAVLAAAIDERLPPLRAAFVRSLVLGERGAVSDEVEAGFRAAGATHVLSVSGLHLTAIAGLVFLLVRRAVLRFPALALRCPADALAAGVALPAVLLYALLTGEAVATARAAIMGGAGFAAVFARRPASAASAIAFAALLIIVQSPLLVLDVSFQLSFSSVAALALAGRRAKERAALAGKLLRAWRWVVGALATTAAASGVTMPLVAHHFGELGPAAPLGNLLLVPLAELGVVPLGLLGAALGTVHPWLGALPLAVAGWLTAVVLWLAEGFRRFAPTFGVPSPSPLETGALMVGAFCAVVSLRGPRLRRLAGAAALLAVLSFGGRQAARRLSRDLRITFLDVGQGDAALIEGPGGFTALIDGGGNVDGTFDPGERVIVPLLRRRGIGRLDLVALSHPHPDHMNGLFRVLETVDVGALWTSGDRGDNPAYDRLLALARTRAVALPRPAAWAGQGLVIQAHGPWLDDRIAAPPGLSVNDASLVLRVGYAGRWLLFDGDLEEQGEAELVAGTRLGRTIASDVLKVPHHGSRTSSTAELLGAVNPSLAVISLGRRNRFGFPRPEVLRRYRDRGIEVRRTDVDGAVTVVIDPSGRLSTTWARRSR
jgi:competence protein ComEC